MSIKKSAASALSNYRPGQVLFKEGEPSQSLFLIKKGTVAVRKMKGAHQVELARVYANEVLGELSFFDRSPRSASATALTEVEAMEISFESLDKIYDQFPDYMKTIVASMAERLRKANDVIRKLQKDVVKETDNLAGGVEVEGPTASEVLAATLDPGSTSTEE